MEKEKKVSFFEKYGLTPVESDKEMDTLGEKIESAVANHNHFEQLSRGGHILMRGGVDIYRIIRKFKEDLLELACDIPGITLRDIRVKTRYSEEIILDIIKYLGSDIIIKENNGIVCYSLSDSC